MLSWSLLTLCALILRLGTVAKVLKDLAITQRSGAPIDPAVGRVLLFITAVVDVGEKSDHMSHLHHLWPVLLRKNRMLRSADVLLYAGVKEDGFDETLTHMVEQCLHGFPNNNIRAVVVENVGYQKGAIDAMLDGVRNLWFDDYDW